MIPEKKRAAFKSWQQRAGGRMAVDLGEYAARPPRRPAPRPRGAKLPRWEANLAEYIRLAKRWKFAWGAHDCCMHAAAVFKIQYGTDPAADSRWTYNDAKGAAAMLRKRYRGSVLHVPKKHGLQPVPVKLAQRGDIVSAMLERRRGLGVCFGLKSYFVGRVGLVPLPTLECDHAWRMR